MHHYVGKLGCVYEPDTDSIVGACFVEVGTLRMPVVERFNLSSLRDALARTYFEREMRAGGDEVGFGFLKKAWKAAWNKAKKVAKAVGIAKVLRKVKNAAKKVLATAKKVVQHPAFATAIGIVSAAVPGVGPLIGAGYAGVRAALALADGLKAKNAAALATVGKYAAGAVPGGKEVLALVESVAPVNASVAASDNPWLRGLSLATA